MKKANKMLLFLTLIFYFINISIANAQEAPYEGYIYSGTKDSRLYPVANQYIGDSIIYGDELNVGSFNNPQDLFVDSKLNIYILDTGNNRIIILNSNYKLKKVIDKFKSNKGEDNINEAEGLYVKDNGDIFVADTGNNRVLLIDNDGNIKKQYLKPDTNLLSENYVFKPKKVLEDNFGRLYVISEGIYKGAITYDRNGNFIGFFGGNKISDISSKLKDIFWKKILNKKQKEKMERFVPIELTNLDIDSESFIYTSSMDNIRKLNPMGKDLLEDREEGIAGIQGYGDVYHATDVTTFDKIEPSFIDINIDEKGFINALDKNTGRIFQYDQQNNLLSIFGGIGDQKGNFKDPQSIESVGDNIIVLDSEKRNLTVYKPTEFGKNIREATFLYNDGLYDKAIIPWQKVANQCSNYEFAFIGIGKSQLQNFEFYEAMKSFKLGNNREMYSQAYKEYRKDKIRENFLYIFLFIILLLVVIFILFKKRKKTDKKQKANQTKQNKLLPLYNIIHPLDGYNYIKQNHQGSIKISIIIIVTWFISKIISLKYTGFIFNYFNREDFRIIDLIKNTICIFILWTIINWALCTLIDGKGKFHEIWVASAYALIPVTITNYLVTFVSNYLCMDEVFFLDFISLIGKIWSLILLIVAMYIIHEFTFKKTVSSMFLTVAGMFVFLFLVIMIYALFDQLSLFISSIYKEIILRI